RWDQMARQRGEKVSALRARAMKLRDEQKYAEAVDTLDIIRKLDPTDTWAAEQHATLSRFTMLLDEKDANLTELREHERSLVDVRMSAVPWYEVLRYPRDWPEATLKRQPSGTGDLAESEADRAVHKTLRQVLPKLDFAGIAFGDTIQFLRDVSNVNIHVNWEAMRQVNIDQKTQVNVKLTQVSVEKALRTVLDDVGGVNPLGFVVAEGVITISTKDDLSRETRTRVYDIRDLIVTVPDFRGPRTSLSRGTGNNAGAGLFGDDDDDDDDDEDTLSRAELTENILELIRSTIAPDTWRSGDASGTIGSVRELNGRIIVTQTPENQQGLQDLLAQLRAARAPQVDVGGKRIAGQRAAGTIKRPKLRKIHIRPPEQQAYVSALTVPERPAGGPASDIGRLSQADGKELRKFIADNYRWALKPQVAISDGGTLLLGGQGLAGEREREMGGPILSKIPILNRAFQNRALVRDEQTLVTGGQTLPGGLNVEGLASRLRSNWDQKIAVNSVNINVDTARANSLGINFIAGNNDTSYTVIDEAQLRTLMELEASRPAAATAVPANERRQDTIVGTDVLLANDMIANNAFAADYSNKFNINDNIINLPHAKYILISNGGFLTVVRSGAHQFWQDAPADVRFVEVPVQIEVPPVGRLGKFEKKLIQPQDDLFITANYVWKGDGK
ncbi:hypothetical protein LCGC14_1981740, partial [marine sediment metagenome]